MGDFLIGEMVRVRKDAKHLEEYWVPLAYKGRVGEVVGLRCRGKTLISVDVEFDDVLIFTIHKDDIEHLEEEVCHCVYEVEFLWED